MSRLRIALPPLHELTHASDLEFARLDSKGHVGETGRSTLMQLGALAGRERVECFLHPSDSVLTRLELPPLPAARISAAVELAVQALTLAGSQPMLVAHSRRSADGQVQVCWLPAGALDGLSLALTQSRLKLGGLFPAPYRLPLPTAGQLSACLADDQLLLRYSLEHGAVEPMVEEQLNRLHASGSDLQWIDDPQQRWAGQTPGWGLHGAVSRSAAPAQGWGRALACCALAAGVWIAGLNVYAAREAGQGQQLKAQMSQRVKQAFPELPVILNPLQQARQQLAARQNANANASGQDQLFSYLLLQAGNTLPALVGSVQQLSFSQGQLQLALASDTPAQAVDATAQAALDTAGLTATRTGSLWTLSAAVAAAADDSDNPRDEEDE